MVGLFISGFTFNIIKIHKAPLKGYLQMIPTLESNLNHGELKSKRREKKNLQTRHSESEDIP